MPIYATDEAKAFWKACPARSRTLAASKFVTLADSKIDNTWRKVSCESIKNGKAINDKSEAHIRFINDLSIKQNAEVVFAKLEARLIIDAANGVLENGGICLDRTSGVPFIPGSAIKGAARRYAIWKLGETEDLSQKAQLLADICFTFGYGDQEWKSGRSGKKNQSISDFWLAMHPLAYPGDQHDDIRDRNWSTVADQAALLILDQLGRQPKESTAPHKQLPNLAGSVCFLPAYPERDPGIDIDILTCHHGDYYAGTLKVATDDESPNPVMFPTVAKGASFRFAITPNLSTSNLAFAKSCLTEAVQLFGLGAKTAAGYGWFSIDQGAQVRADKEREATQTARAKEEKLAAMSDDERTEHTLTELDHTEFVAICKNILNEEHTKQLIVCKMLQSSKKAEWKKWRKQKKGDWPNHVPQIREIAKNHGIELT